MAAQPRATFESDEFNRGPAGGRRLYESVDGKAVKHSARWQCPSRVRRDDTRLCGTARVPTFRGRAAHRTRPCNRSELAMHPDPELRIHVL